MRIAGDCHAPPGLNQAAVFLKGESATEIWQRIKEKKEPILEYISGWKDGGSDTMPPRNYHKFNTLMKSDEEKAILMRAFMQM